MSVPTDLPIGSELLGYRLEEVLGRGGMGIVYLAEDLRLKRKVALKLLSPELAGDERFRRALLAESELAASLDHPNIIPIYEAGEIDGRIFVSMRYVEGADLKRLLRRGPLLPERALALIGQIASALDAAHGRGLVHGDVKPSNILIARADQEGSDHVYLADFGLTRRLAEREEPDGHGQLMGTVDYVAPERIAGRQVDGRGDLYSLGCVLYECLSGEPPFPRGSDAAVLFAHLDTEPPTLPELQPVLAKALAKSPDDRYQSGRELVEAARKHLGMAAPRRARARLLAAGVVAVGMVGAALLTFFLSNPAGPVPSAATGRLIRIDPARNTVARTLALGANPTGITVGAGQVWMTTYRDSSIWRVDPRSLDVLRIAANGMPVGVAVDGGSAYVGDSVGTTRIDPRSGRAVQTIATSAGAQAIASGQGGVWIADGANMLDRVTRLNSIVGAVEQRVAIPLGAPADEEHALFNVTGLAVGDGSVWVLGDVGAPRLWRIYPTASRIVATVRLPFPPGGVADGLGGVWVTAQLGDRLLRIDPRTNRIVAEIPVGREPLGVTVGGRIGVGGQRPRRLGVPRRPAIESRCRDGSPGCKPGQARCWGRRCLGCRRGALTCGARSWSLAYCSPSPSPLSRWEAAAAVSLARSRSA